MATKPLLRKIKSAIDLQYCPFPNVKMDFDISVAPYAGKKRGFGGGTEPPMRENYKVPVSSSRHRRKDFI